MNTENIKYIQDLMLKQTTTGFGRIMTGHYILFWYDPANATFVGYEGKDPVKCYQSVEAKHPSYEFAALQAVPTSNVAVELIKALKTVNLMMPDLQNSLETLRIARSTKST